MLTNLIKNFMSRGEAKTFISYVLENGSSQITDQPDGIDYDEGIDKVLGSIVSSAKLFHISKHYPNRLKINSCAMSSSEEKPDMPAPTTVVSIFYLSKISVTDKVLNEEIKGEVGSTIALASDNYESLVLDTNTEPVYRLFVFWEDE